MYNVLWVGAHSDKGYYFRLKEKLEGLGIALNCAEDYIHLGEEFEKAIVDVIADSLHIILFISEASLNSAVCLTEIKHCFCIAKNRAKNIVPIVQWGQATFERASSKEANEMHMMLQPIQWYLPEDGLHSEKDYNKLASFIDNLVSSERTTVQLYEQLAAFTKMKYSEGIVSSAAKLITILHTDLSTVASQEERKEIYINMCRLIEMMDKWSFWGYDQESRQIAHECISAIQAVQSVLNEDDFQTSDLLMVSIAKWLISHMMNVWCDAIEILSNDDCHSPGVDSVKKYTERYDLYEFVFRGSFQKYDEMALREMYSANAIRLIHDADACELTIYNRPKKVIRDQKPEVNQQLAQIAEYLQKANSLFDSIAAKKEQMTFLQCLKTSYERLKQYCEEIACSKIGAACIEKITEINQKIENFSEDSDASGTEENAFRALLGFKSVVNNQYDVFISYKHEDLDIAYNVYHFMNANLLLPFFDKVTLPEIGDSEYEDAIMNALENASHFVVIITNLQQLDSHWVKLEMNTFHHEIVEGRKDESNFILLVTDEVYHQITESNKKCINIKFRSYEIMRISQYKTIILDYLR